jgi:hypothetical protein
MPIDRALLGLPPLENEEDEKKEESRKKDEPKRKGGIDMDLLRRAGGDPPQKPGKIPVAKMDDDAYLRYARKRMDQSMFPQIEQTLVGMGGNAVSLIDRALGNDERASQMTKVTNAFAQAAAERDPKGWKGSVLKAGRGVGTTLPPAILAGVTTGGPGAIIYAAGTEANNAITEGEEAGLSGKKLATYVAAKGGIEGGIAGAFQMVGAGGAEKVIGQLGKQTAAAVGAKAALKKLTLDLGEEVVEEIYTEVGHAVADAASGVNPDSLTAENLAQLSAETTLQTVMTMGLIGAPGVTNSVKEANKRKQIMKYAKEGKTPSRKQWKSWGMPVEDGKSAKDRKNLTAVAAISYTEEAQAAIQAAGDQEAAAAGQAPQAAAQQQPAPEAGIQPPGAGGPQQAAQGVSEDAQLTPQGEYPILKLVDEAADQAKAIEEQGPMRATSQDVKPDDPAGDFIKDESGRMGVSVKALAEVGKKGKAVAKKFLTAPGDLPVEAFKAKETMEGKISKVQHQLAQTTKELDKALDAVFRTTPKTRTERYAGKKIAKALDLQQEIPEIELERINDVMKGEAPEDILDPRLRGPVMKMRNQIDSFSRDLMHSGAISGEMAATISEKLETYVTRSYRAFDDPAWIDKIPAEVMNKALAHFRTSYPDATNEELQGHINAAIKAEGTAFNKPAVSRRSKDLTKEERTMLKMQKNLPEVYRDLLGEYKDPRVNYARSIVKIADLLAQHEMHQKVRDAGLQGGFFRTAEQGPVAGGPLGDLDQQIIAGENSELMPLNGLWTTTAIRDAFLKDAGSPSMPAWMKAVIRANGAIKANKTILSHVTQIRNVLANTGFALSNGHWDARKFKEAFMATKVGLFDEGSDKWKEYHGRLVELGVIGQSIHAEELRNNVRDATDMGLENWAMSGAGFKARWPMKMFRKGYEKAAKLYQAGDDIWKIYAFENEKARYSKAKPNWTEAQVDEYVADIVKNTYPTYSRVSDAIKTVRQIPLTGTFVSFPAEVIRTQYHTVRIAREEMADPDLADIGATRMKGTVSSVLATGLMSAASAAFMGISWGEDEDIRKFVPPWQQNALFVYLRPPKDGKYSYIDMSFLDPKTTLTAPLMAMLRGDNPADGLWDGFKQLAAPFADEELINKVYTEVWRNKKAGGGRVWNPEDSVDQQATDVGWHVGMAVAPGSIVSGFRLTKAALGITSESGQAYSLPLEILNNVLGVRSQRLDIKQSAPWRFKSHMTAVRDVNQIMLGAMSRRGHVSNRELASSFQRTAQGRERVYNDMMETAGAAVRLGVSEQEVGAIMRGAGVPKADLAYVAKGLVPPIKMTKTRLKTMHSANPAEFKDRIAVLEKAMIAHGISHREQTPYDIVEGK